MVKKNIKQLGTRRTMQFVTKPRQIIEPFSTPLSILFFCIVCIQIIFNSYSQIYYLIILNFLFNFSVIEPQRTNSPPS